MRLRWAIVILLAVAMPAALGQQPSEPADAEAVLRRTRERLLADLARLPRYTCVQTVTRRYYDAPPGSHSCPRLIEEHEKRASKSHELPARGWDRLRLEVAIAEGQSVFSWVGAARFETGNLDELAGRGPLGTGDFGSFLGSVLRRSTISFREERVVAGRRRLEYSYDMPVGRSGYLVKTTAGWTPTAYSGSLLLDPDESDVVSLTVRTAELPESNPACQATSEVEYGRTMIHDRMVLIPRGTRLSTIDRQGTETLSATEYESCREYSSKSRILESAPSDAVTAGKPQSEPPLNALSPGLRFESRIVTAIDSDTAAAGDPVEAVLRTPIHDKKNNLLIPAGTRLRGRLARVEHRSGGINTIRVAMQWESIAVAGKDVPLRAVPQGRFGVPGVLVVGDPDFPDAPSFFFRTEHLRLKQFDWTWITQASNGNQKDESNGTAALPRTVEIAENEFPIGAASTAYFKLSVPAGASSARLEGTFRVSGGASNEVEVSLFSSDEFVKWQNQEPAMALYESGRTALADINVPLPSGGVYYLVFSNNFLLSAPKVVQASLHLHYKL